MIIETVYASQFDEGSVDAVCDAANRVIAEVPLQEPILCVLFDADGAELARFTLGNADPTDQTCDDPIEAELRSQKGASLRMVDANGVEAEVLLVVGVGMLQ